MVFLDWVFHMDAPNIIVYFIKKVKKVPNYWGKITLLCVYDRSYFSSDLVHEHENFQRLYLQVGSCDISTST